MTFIQKQIRTFIETNASLEVSHSTIWETLKAYLRGQIIGYASHTKKARMAKLEDLSAQILKLDNQYASAPTAELYQQRIRLQTEFDLASTSKAEQLLLKSRHTFYEFGDKAGKLLAHQARQAPPRARLSKLRPPRAW